MLSEDWGGRIRTCNFSINSRAVCQLTYTPSHTCRPISRQQKRRLPVREAPHDPISRATTTRSSPHRTKTRNRIEISVTVQIAVIAADQMRAHMSEYHHESRPSTAAARKRQKLVHQRERPSIERRGSQPAPRSLHDAGPHHLKVRSAP